MLASIVEDLRRGVPPDKDKIRALQTDPYRHLRLRDAVGVRPSVLKYLLPLDDVFLRDTARDVRQSITAGRRVGVDWLPAAASAVERKDASDDHWATHEHLRPLNDACTKWCTKRYFPDAFARVNMIANVVRVYERLREVSGLGFRIVFKGGVMIRLVLLEFFNNLPPEARTKATEYLDSFRALSLSDFDFEIVPDDHDPPDDLVHRLFLLDYAVLLWVQRAMQREVDAPPSRPGLLTLGWDQEEGRRELRTTLQREADGAEKDSPFHKATIDHVFLGDDVPSPAPRGYRTRSGAAQPSARKNVVIFKCPTGGGTCVMDASRVFREFGVRGVPARPRQSTAATTFYATLNTYIGEEEEEETETRPTNPGFLRGVFHLSRIKHAFVVYYTTRDGSKRCDRLGGEMVDLSQSHGVRLDALRAAMYKEVPQPYRDYPILGVDPREVVLRSYTPQGFLTDHAQMLHASEAPPWDVAKREKRMARYVGFLFAHVLSPEVEGTSATKLRALGRLAARLRSLEDLLASPPLRTGVRPVDALAARERASLAAAPKGKARAYLQTLHRHIHALLSAMDSPGVQQNRPCHTIDLQHFYLTRTLIRNTPILP